MVNIRTLFEALVDAGPGKKLVVQVEDRSEHETIRTQLCKLWTEHKEIIGAVGDDDDPTLQYSMCADFLPSSGNTEPGNSDSTGNAPCARSTFYIGKPRRKVAKSFSFVIVDENDNDNANKPPAATGT